MLKCTSLLWQSQPSKRSCCNFAPGLSGFFTGQKHCCLSTASGGTAHSFHAPPAPKKKHMLATLQLQPVLYPTAQEQLEQAQSTCTRGLCKTPKPHYCLPHRKRLISPSRLICHPPAYDRFSPWPPTAILYPLCLLGCHWAEGAFSLTCLEAS